MLTSYARGEWYKVHMWTLHYQNQKSYICQHPIWRKLTHELVAEANAGFLIFTMSALHFCMAVQADFVILDLAYQAAVVITWMTLVCACAGN